MDAQSVNQQIQDGLALFAAKQRELEMLAAHIEQEKAQMLAMQQTPVMYPPMNPYLGMAQQPLPQPTPSAPQEAPVVEPTPQPTTSLESDIRMLARGLDQQTEKFNAAMDAITSMTNDICARLSALEAKEATAPNTPVVDEPTTPDPVELPQLEEATPEPSVVDRLDMLTLRVDRLADAVEKLVHQQTATNDMLADVIAVLRTQVSPVAGNDDVESPPSSTTAKKRRKQKQRR